MNRTQQAKAAIERKKAEPSAKLAENKPLENKPGPMPVDKSVKGFIDVPEKVIQDLKDIAPAQKVSPPGKGKSFRACCGTKRGAGPHSAECKRFDADGTAKAQP